MLETLCGTIERRTITTTGEKQDCNLVIFTVDGPENPKKWSKIFKWYITMVIAMTRFVVALCSGPGPMVFAPLSEVLGRKIFYVTTLGAAVIFIIPCAVAMNIQTLLVCRIIDGIAFSALMILADGTLADLWRTEERGVLLAAFSAAPFLGPALGLLIGVITVPETADNTSSINCVNLSFQLLFGELVVFLISLYMSVLYGLLYMFFVAQLPPEVRLIPMMCSCWFILICVFIFIWTSYPRISWFGPCLAGFPSQAASALAGKTFLRSMWGGCTVLFTSQMYKRLGYQWASSLLAFNELACCAILFLFSKAPQFANSNTKPNEIEKNRARA
ncbi:major facilitator superfamily domain-containing protein [Kalaharituber pfeilii]|nr:major facilitator superfamily domain-containing protein [Kalaharituber pfeilii]